MAKEGRPARGIQSITIGGRLLQALIDAAKPLTLREIAARADIPPAQAHAYLVSHKRVGLVVQEFDSGPYLLGPQALKLGLGRMRSLPIFRAAGTLLRELSDTLNVMSVLAVWTSKGPAAVMVVQARDKRSDINIRIGTRFSLLSSATGYIFGAFEDPARISAQLRSEQSNEQNAPHLSRSVVSPEEYDTLINAVRASGISMVHAAGVPGIDAVSVPVFDETGKFAAALTCIGHADTFDVNPESDCVRTLLARAGAMQRDLTTPSLTPA